MLALCKEDDLYTRDALLKQDVKYMDIMNVVKKSRDKTGPVQSRGAETMYDALLKYGIDFTEQAKEGKLDPVIGRDDEIRRAIQILSRRTKNNPVLIGDPGVGKVRHEKRNEYHDVMRHVTNIYCRLPLLKESLSEWLTETFRTASGAAN